jgi:transcriptional regulator with XRE-family HTH domain
VTYVKDYIVLLRTFMPISEIIRRQRESLGWNQEDLAKAVGVSGRQVRRWEAGDVEPGFQIAVALAKALQISLEELAGEDTHRVDMTGEWWACWQTWKDGQEVINAHQVGIRQHGDVAEIVAVTRGTALEEGGYLWRGELRLWDNEILMGWYAASEAAVRSKGVMFFVLHQHGIHATGRWVGLSYDGPLVTGWGALARTEEDVLAVMDDLKSQGVPSS